METQQGNGKAANPLRAKKIDYIANWAEWKELWEKESRTDFLHSLLHFGFGIDGASFEEAIERICLYLDIADGCFDFHTFNTFEGIYGPVLSAPSRFSNVTDAQARDLRRILSQKAFQMLCQNFFKNTTEKHHYPYPSWLRLAVVPQIFSKILWFFRLDEYGRIFNLSSATGHNVEVAEEFIRQFCLIAWECNEEEALRAGLSDSLKEIFRQARPSMIEILSGLGKLDLLLKDDRYRTIDKKCEAKLENLSLAFDRWLPNLDGSNSHRKPKTIEEACFGKSQAAQVLILLRIMRKQDAHFKKLRYFEEQRRNAEKEIKSRTS